MKLIPLSLSIGAVALAASLSASPVAAGEYTRVAPAPAASAPVSGPYYAKRRGGIGAGGAAALGVLGGVAVGAAIAGAARPAAPVVVEEAAPVVVQRAPRRVYVEETTDEECVTESRRVYVPGWGYETRRRTSCE